MAGRNVRVPREAVAFFNPLSLGRKGPAPRATRADVAQISRILRGAPEVMVKVTGGSGSPSGVMASLRYVGREGTLPIETDTGEAILNKDQRSELVKSWNLDLVRGRYRRLGDRDLDDVQRRRPSRVAYNIVLGMPAPTPPKAVLNAARQFAREHFAATHRYAMVLHTDQAHPHVHLVVKAEDEHGRRLRIDKAKLRAWREQFAEALRDQGIEANASSRFERGRPGRRLNTKTLRASRAGSPGPGGARYAPCGTSCARAVAIRTPTALPSKPRAMHCGCSGCRRPPHSMRRVWQPCRTP
jgi:hypothetical protein